MSEPGSSDAIRTDLVRMHRLVLDQLRRGLASFAERDATLAEVVIDRDDVVDNLNIAIEEAAIERLGHPESGEERRFVRAALKVAANLERAGDAACHIAERTLIAGREGRAPAPLVFPRLEALATISLDEAMRGFIEMDPEMARQACEREPELDAEYVSQVKRLEAALRTDPEAAASYLDSYAVMKYLEKIADYSLNIGEQALFVLTGRRLKFGQLRSLDRLQPSAGAGFQRFWDGISGAVVARLGQPAFQSVFKEGSERKIGAEAEQLDRWEQIAPGLTPHVLGTVSAEGRMALLREFVEGDLLSDLLFSGEVALERKVELASELAGVLKATWERTRRDEPAGDDYVGQIEQRLADVFALHPGLRSLAASGLDDGRPLHVLLQECRRRQRGVGSTFSVWVHGDLNANNVIVSHSGLRFIDVHRSHFGDHLQDVGVLLVSLIRAPGLSVELRADLGSVSEVIERAATEFSGAHDDGGVEERLGLSRARSLITSARVVVDEAHAAELFRSGMRGLAAFAAAPV